MTQLYDRTCKILRDLYRMRIDRPPILDSEFSFPRARRASPKIPGAAAFAVALSLIITGCASRSPGGGLCDAGRGALVGGLGTIAGGAMGGPYGLILGIVLAPIGALGGAIAGAVGVGSCPTHPSGPSPDATLVRRAADDNDPAAQYELAMQVSSRDDQRYWLCRSASQPHALQGGAFYQLGRLYQNKYGDPVEAHRWYSAAAAHDNVVAIRQLEEMGKTMTIEQIEEADRRAAAWKPGDCGSAPPRAATPVRPHSIERRA